MKYAMIVTERKAFAGMPNDPKHWLMRGTLVKVLRETELGAFVVETLCPVFGVDNTFLHYHYAVKLQHVDREDFVTLPDCMGPVVEASAKTFQRARELFAFV